MKCLNPVEYKMMVFRLPEALKREFRMVLMQNHLEVQHTLAAFIECFIEYTKLEYTKGYRDVDSMKMILRRSQTLAGGV